MFMRDSEDLELSAVPGCCLCTDAHARAHVRNYAQPKNLVRAESARSADSGMHVLVIDVSSF